MGQFLILISLLQKRIRLDFDEFDKELLADVPICSSVASGQPSEGGDARVRRPEPVDFRARAAFSVTEIPDGIMGMSFGRMDRGKSFRRPPLPYSYLLTMKWMERCLYSGGVSLSPCLGPRRRRVLKPRRRETA